jgi:hypothetical protein
VNFSNEVLLPVKFLTAIYVVTNSPNSLGGGLKDMRRVKFTPGGISSLTHPEG